MPRLFLRHIVRLALTASLLGGCGPGESRSKDPPTRPTDSTSARRDATTDRGGSGSALAMDAIPDAAAAPVDGPGTPTTNPDAGVPPVDPPAAPDAAPATCVATGPVLHWKLDEETGTIAEDASGNGLRGTYVAQTNASTPAAAVAPVKFAFENPRSRSFVRGERQAVQLAGMPAAIKPPAGLTVAIWYRTSSLDVGGGTAPGSELVSAGDSYLLRLRKAAVEVSKRVGAAGWVRCRQNVVDTADGKWQHLAAVIDATTVRLYFDGIEGCALANEEPLVYDRGTDLWVGRHGHDQTTYEFDGNLDDLRIYARALAPLEIFGLSAGGP